MMPEGTNLQLLPCLFLVCTGAEAQQSKFLLVLMSGICYVELPIIHSKFQSYVWVSEVLSGRPVALNIICRNGGKFLSQPWPPPMFVEILDSQVEDSIMKIRPTPWPSFSHQVEVESKEQWTTVCYVSFDVGLCGSKENMAWCYYLQFVLEPVLFKGQVVPDGDFDLHWLLHGSVLQVVLTLPLSIVCDGVVLWDCIKVLWCDGTEKPYMYNSCSILFDTGITFLHTGNILITILHLIALLYSWTPSNYKMMLLLLCVNCLSSQLVMERYRHWKFSESEQLWGTDLPISMGDMSYSASGITRLHPHEVVNVKKHSSSEFGLSKLALVLLFGKHSETSSCQVSVEHVLQWPPPIQNEFRTMLVELEKLLGLLKGMSMQARVELFAGPINMKGLLSSGGRSLQLYRTVFSCSEQRKGDYKLEPQAVMRSKSHDQAFLMNFVSNTVAMKEDQPNWRSSKQVTLLEYSNTKCRSAFVQITPSIKYIQVIWWDPGGAKLSTIRPVVFLLQLQPCRSRCWYQNSNRCCIINSSNYWSSWVLVPCQNIGSETTCFLNASIQQILLQDNEARVQVSQTGQYQCYLKQLNGDWCHGRFILSIVSASNMGSRWFEGCHRFCYNGLGASRVSRRGVCHDTTRYTLGWADQRAYVLGLERQYSC